MKNMFKFNLKPLACLVTEPPGVSCWCLLVTGSCPPARCSPVCRSEQRGVVAADQFLHRAAVTSQLCRDPRPVQTCTPWPAWRYSTVTSDHVSSEETPCGAPASSPRCWPRCCRWPPPTGPRRPRTSLWPRSPTCQTPSQQVSVLNSLMILWMSKWKLWSTSDTLTIDNWHQMDTCN